MKDEPTYEVVWPLGKTSSSAAKVNSPISDLNGKTIGELSVHVTPRDDLMFATIREKLLQRFPDVRFVDSHTFGFLHGPEENELVDRLPELLRQHSVDAVISSMGI
ncbi:MAG: hypothetical protein HYX94_10435 [Chloroflexi bacterium]|nr:hypothetical protein [Chloroflexota bacterium]